MRVRSHQRMGVGGTPRDVGHRRGAYALWLCVVSTPAMTQTLPTSERSLDLDRGTSRELPAEATLSDTPYNARTAPSIASSLGPYADPGGLRAFLGRHGITYTVDYIGEALGNATGGLKRGAIYEGRLDVQVTADLERILGWDRTALHGNVYQIHGRGLSSFYLDNLLVVSGIEALPSTRLFEVYLEHRFEGNTGSLRVGQLAADSEFLRSRYAGLFVNATFSWPAITAADLPSGGPAFVLATPGARVEWRPSETFRMRAAVFNGNPAGGRIGEPQRIDASGLEFRLRDPPFVIAEAVVDYGRGTDLLPDTAKIGAWTHFDRFDDQRFATTGLSLADPTSTSGPRRLRGDGGMYAILDQLVYRPAGRADAGIGVFGRVSLSPSDRNLIDLYADAGISVNGFVPGRPYDTFGIAAGYARISGPATSLDRDVARFLGTPYSIRSSEIAFETTYQAQLVPGWAVQPTVQYIVRPGGGIPNPFSPRLARIGDALVVGLRTTIRY